MSERNPYREAGYNGGSFFGDMLLIKMVVEEKCNL